MDVGLLDIGAGVRFRHPLLRSAVYRAADAEDRRPVRDVPPLRSKAQPKGAIGLTAEQLRDLLQKLQVSKFCQDHDLVDPITLLIATGLRRSEMLGLRWTDYDDEACTLAVTGKVVRVSGEALQRVDETKSVAGRRIVPVPRFAVENAAEPSRAAVPRTAGGDLPVDGGHTPRPE